jgi:hypothetical protein
MKFFVFISLLVSGWYVMRWLQNFEEARRLRGQRGADRRKAAPPTRVMRATDTVVCKRCGTYVPSDFPTACDRADCPFPSVG